MYLANIKKYLPHLPQNQNVSIEICGNAAIFEISATQIKEIICSLKNNKNLQFKFITATDERGGLGCFRIWYVFGVPKEHTFIVPFIQLKNTKEFPSIASVMRESCHYERKIRTFFGLIPVDHPDNRSLILHENWPSNVYPLRKDVNWNIKPAGASGVKYQFQKVGGDGIYEIPVGPIHAGIIEPGHLRFSVAGEEIVLLESRFGFTHKGSEKLFEILSPKDMLRLSEKISGDSSFSHSLAFCQAMEQLTDVIPPRRACYLRTIYAELERLANHLGDIGAIMLDAGFNFGGTHGARLKEIVMQIHEKLTGSRFLRAVNICGGVTKDISIEDCKILSNDLSRLLKDFSEVSKVAENSASLLNRLKGTGVLSYETATNYGATGIAAKCVGIKKDVRVDFPYAAYDELLLERIETEKSGDVYARFCVRIKEVYASIVLIERALCMLPSGSIRSEKCNDCNKLKENFVAISAVEGWRGEIFYFIKTDAYGKIERIVPLDPSFVNWRLLSPATVGNIILDFPLINKSFNLSYAGNDL